jgi:hypothetical protein
LVAKSVAAVAAVGLVLSPAIAAGQSKKRPPAVSLSFDPVSSFTPANGDPKLAASLAGRLSAITDFKFTPAAAKGRPSQLRVAIRARSSDSDDRRVAAASPVTTITPASYNLGVAVGWRQFAVSGDVSKVKSPDPAFGARETAVVGVSYSLKRFTARVAAGAARDDAERGVPALRERDNYSLDVGGAYNITRNIALTGGVRYRIDKDRMSAIKDDRRDSQAVYVGTAFKF